MSLDTVKKFLFKQPKVDKIDEPHVIADVKEEDYKLYERFMEKYNPAGDFKFSDVQFRKGAAITCPFGIAEGFKYIDGKMVWGYVRFHTGVDRASGGDQVFDWGTVRDIVKVPFDFESSKIYEYGDKSYGTLTCLINKEFQFEMRVAHLNPDQKKRKGNEKGPMLKWSYDEVKKKRAMGKNYILGSAGTLGDSSGAHTHTEFKSLDESCEVFDILLLEKYGEAVLKEYTPSEVITEYRKYKAFKAATEEAILKDYNELRKEKRVIFFNRFKCQYVDYDKTIKTRYSSELLFNGL